MLLILSLLMPQEELFGEGCLRCWGLRFAFSNGKAKF
jgi:hypothetical protein